MEPTETPTRDRYLFTGWYVDPECAESDLFDFAATSLRDDLVLYAGWEHEDCLVSFIANDTNASLDGNETLETQAVTYGDKVERPTEPTRTGYTFAGWYTVADPDEDDEEFDFDSGVTADTILYAKWDILMLSVEFDANGGNPGDYDKQSVEYESTADKPAVDPSKDNCTFGGWYEQVADEPLDAETAASVRNDADLSKFVWVTDEDYPRIAYDFDSPIEADVTLYARWLPAACTVEFDADGGTPQPESRTVDYGAALAQPAAAPAKDGYDFKGW